MRKTTIAKTLFSGLVLLTAGLGVLVGRTTAPAEAGYDVVDWDGGLPYEEIGDDSVYFGRHGDRSLSSLRGIAARQASPAEPINARVPLIWTDRIGSMRCHADLIADATDGSKPNDMDVADLAAAKEVETFYGHLMLPRELQRASEIRRDHPGLAAKIDVLVAGQAEMRAEDEREKHEFRAGNEKWARDEAAKKREHQDPWTRVQAEARLVPNVCGLAEAGHRAFAAAP